MKTETNLFQAVQRVQDELGRGARKMSAKESAAESQILDLKRQLSQAQTERNTFRAAAAARASRDVRDSALLKGALSV